MALLFQSRLLQSIAYRGQPVGVVVFLVMLALWLDRERRSSLAGLAASLALTKFTLVLPLLALWGWERRWRSLAWTAAITALLSVPVLASIGPWQALTGLADSIAFIAQWNRAFVDSHTVSLDSILKDVPAGAAAAVRAAALAACLLTALLLVHRRDTEAQSTAPWVFAGLTTLGSLAVYHRVYDLAALLPFALLVWDRVRSRGWRSDAPTLVLSASMAGLLFVFSVQSVAQATERALQASGLGLFAPVATWLCIVASGCIALVVVRVRREAAGSGLTLSRTALDPQTP